MHNTSYRPYNHRHFGVLAGSFCFQIILERDRGTGWCAHEQPLWHHLFEGRVGSTSQKPVQFNQQPGVDVLALVLLVLNLSAFVVADVHSHDGASHSTRSGKNNLACSLDLLPDHSPKFLLPYWLLLHSILLAILLYSLFLAIWRAFSD